MTEPSWLLDQPAVEHDLPGHSNAENPQWFGDLSLRTNSGTDGCSAGSSAPSIYQGLGNISTKSALHQPAGPGPGYFITL